jgi:hypothetical protein
MENNVLHTYVAEEGQVNHQKLLGRFVLARRSIVERWKMIQR